MATAVGGVGAAGAGGGGVRAAGGSGDSLPAGWAGDPGAGLCLGSAGAGAGEAVGCAGEDEGAASTEALGPGGGFGVGLDEPLAAATDPGGGGVVVEVAEVGLVFGAAVEGVDDVVGGEGGGGAEDADLQVAEFVGGEVTLLEGDEEGVECGDVAVDLDEVRREEAANGGEASFGEGAPEMLLLLDDFERGGGGVDFGGARLGLSEGGDEKGQEQSTHGGDCRLSGVVSPGHACFRLEFSLHCRSFSLRVDKGEFVHGDGHARRDQAGAVGGSVPG